MFEVAEIGSKVDKAEYERRAPELRMKLLEAQQRLRAANFPVLILINGDDWESLGEALHLLHEWLDPRYMETNAFGDPSDEESERPPFWRYWRAIPSAGRIGIFFGAWYSRPIRRRIKGACDDASLDRALDLVVDFERILADGGALFVKLWFHTTLDVVKKRLKKLKQEKLPVPREERNILKFYNRGTPIVERALRKTSVGAAPWTLIESTDWRHRNLAVGEALLEALNLRLSEARERAPAAPPTPAPPPAAPPANRHTILDTLDLSQAIPPEEYDRRLEELQGRLAGLIRRSVKAGRGCILLFEGWDAAGKGGLIRRFTGAMDARNFRVIPIAAPTDEERAHHYLWRFWRHLPRAGRVTVFDRSWYGRVLVERVEGFASPAEWMRAYREINSFEEQLAIDGLIVLKYWLHIGKDEQLRRFQEREQTPYKQYKITAEDYRNREKWDAYEAAANEMIGRTSTEYAPWILIEANDKRFARIKALKVFCERLEAALDR